MIGGGPASALRRWWSRSAAIATFAFLLVPLGLTAAPPAAEPAESVLRLGQGALAYRPAGLAPQPAPILILLHGARGGPEEMIGRFRAQADAKGVVLLAPRARGASWDLILEAARSAQTESADLAMSPPRPRPGVDPPRIEAALARLARHIPVDRSRIGLAGFSDGASYALSLGPRRPHAYRAILAFSPGMMILPSGVPGGQRIFIAYGRQDGPFTERGSMLAADLRQRQQNVTAFPFEGGHTIPEAVAARGVAFFLEEAGG